MKLIKLLFCFLVIVEFANAATVYYVSSTGSGADGLSWATAYVSPAAALAGSPVAGDEVWVKQGTYISATTLSWKTGINFYGGFVGTETLRSERSTDATLTILEGTNTNKVLNAPSMASATTWDGFTIQKGLSTGGGGGVFMQKNAILSNCIIQNNKTTSFGGGAIFIQGTTGDADSIKVINCIIKNNIITYAGAAKRGGGGIYVKAGSYKAVIRGCTIESNTADGLANSGSDIDGGGVYLCDGILENSTVKNNIVTNKNASTSAISYTGKCQGGGVFIMPQTTTNPIIVRNCIITGNSAQTSLGGGICIDPLWTSSAIAAPVNISKTIISNNFAYKNGGGILAEEQSTATLASSSYTFDNCIIANNRSEKNPGGGAFIANISGSAGTVSFLNCHIVNNRMSTYNFGGGGIYFNNIPALIKNCVFWGNTVFGATPLKHHVRTAGVDGNQIVNCAFDSRFLATDVWATTDLTGLITVDVANTGSEFGKLYTNFVNPTAFAGSVVTNNADSVATITAANWSITAASAFLNAGTTLATVTSDFSNVARPQGNAYDIGAYEIPYYNTTITFNANGTVDSYLTGAVVNDVKGKQLAFTITANSLYKITSVIYNSIEVKGDMVGAVYTAPALSANASLVVQFDLATGLDKTSVNLHCISVNNGIEINGLTSGQEVMVYNFAGVKIANKTANSSNVSVALPQGIYLVKVANTVKKVIVK
jgi:hypothetical protein